MAPSSRGADLHAVQLVRGVGEQSAVGRAMVQEHVADRPAVEPGDQQDAAPGPLPGQVLGEEPPLADRRHQRGEVGVGRGSDLHHTDEDNSRSVG
jgi:hypothetical protein